MISTSENAKLQRANFEAEREMERTREYEMMGRQMGRLDLFNGKHTGRQGRRNLSELEEDGGGDVDVLGLGPKAEEVDECGMGGQEAIEDW
jgi:hypothetical protein